MGLTNIVQASFLAIGLGILVNNGCIPAVAAGAGSYAGAKMAQSNKNENVQVTSEWVELGQGTLRFGRGETSRTYCSGDCVSFNGAVYMIKNPYKCKDRVMGWTHVQEWKNPPQILIVNMNQTDNYGGPVEFKKYGKCKKK